MYKFEKMDEERPDLIIGIDFGMTCTGKGPLGGLPYCSHIFFSHPVSPIHEQLIDLAGPRGGLCKPVHRQRRREIDTKMAGKGAIRRV